MNKFTKTLGLTALVLGIGVGCSNNNDGTNNKPEYEILIAKPLGVGESYAHYGGELAIVVSLGNEQILCYTKYKDTNTSTASQGAALVNAEINDGDNEPIKMIGKYVDKKFEISKLIVGDYTIEY